jgi:mannosyltransferase
VPFRIWHARRNDDMLVGLLLRDALRMPVAVIFTSAAQRRHTRWTQALIRRMDAIIATSPESASYLLWPAVVIPHGMDMVAFHPAPDRAALRRRYGLPDRLLVGCFGRVRHSKGTDLFVEAVIDLARRRPDVAAVVTGLTQPEDREFERTIRARIAAEGLEDRFLWLGEVERSQMADMYRCLDVFVAPQRKEGFGVTPLEAMATGLPVVATTAGTFRSQIADGETGFIVPLEDAPAIAAAILRLAEDADLRRRMGEAGRRRVAERFRIEGEAEAINAVYHALWRDGRKERR